MDNTRKKVMNLLMDYDKKKKQLETKIIEYKKNDNFEDAFKADLALRGVLVMISGLEHCLAE